MTGTTSREPQYAPGLTQHHIKLTADTGRLHRLLAAVGKIVDKARIHFEEDRIWMSETSASGTSAVRGEVAAVEWETDVCECTVAVDVHPFRRRVRHVGQETGSVTLRVDASADPGEEITLTGNTGMTWQEATDPSELRDEIDFDGVVDYDYDTTVCAEAYKFKGAIGGVCDASSTGIRLTGSDGSLLVEGDGFGDDGSGDWEPDFDVDDGPSWEVEADVDGPRSEQSFSPDILHDIAYAIPSEGMVEIGLDGDYPIYIQSSHDIECAVAPRFTKEDV